MADWTSTHLPCPCGKSSDAFSINDRGWGKCFSCDKDIKLDDDAAGSTPATTTSAPKADPNLLTDLEFVAITARGLSAETCKKWGYGIGADKRGEPVHVAQYVRDGRVVAQKLRTRDKKFTVLGTGKDMPLFGQHLWSGSGKMVVVTEGEIDALSVSQLQDNKWPVVSLPNGAQSAEKSIANALDWLNGYEKVILMFDQDEPGRDAIAKAAEVLPPGKAYVASLPLKDANACLTAGKGEEVRRAIWNATPWRPDAILGGLDLLPRLLSYKGAQGRPWPWQGLNAMLPVIEYPAITTIVAGTGSGKSTLCRAIEHHLIRAGENLGAMHLEESVERSALGIVGYDLGQRIDLSAGGVNRRDLEEAYRSTVGREGVFFYDHFGSVGIDNMLAKVRYMARAGRCRYIVLDHLSIVVSGLDIADERKAIDVAMTGLRTLTQETGIGLILVNHLRRGTGKPAENGGEISLQDLRGSQAIAQLSDCVIALERDQQAEGEARNLSTVRLLKNRQTGETGPACKLLYDKRSGRLMEVPLAYGESDVQGDEFQDETQTAGVSADDDIPF